MSKSIDQLVMLLSSDWFLPKWHLLGLGAQPEAKAALQKSCRTLTVEFLDGEVDYWMISFDPARIGRTQANFFAAVVRSKLSVSDVEVLQRIANRTEDEENDQRDASLLVSLTLLLTTSGAEVADESLGERVISAVRSTSRAFELDMASIAPEWLCSNSEWDKQLREMTADLPEYLADFAQDLVTSSNKFLLFWKALMGKVDTDQRASLVAWYKVTALKLVGQHIELPLTEG